MKGLGTDERDGNWMDSMGCCKVCDGEIPHGHTDECDIFQHEKKERELELKLSTFKSIDLIRIDTLRAKSLELEEKSKKLSTLEGIIQKQKEALRVVVDCYGEDLARLDLQLCDDALALSPSTFASRFVEREKVDALLKALELLHRENLDVNDADPDYFLSDLYRIPSDALSDFASQQPEGAGKE